MMTSDTARDVKVFCWNVHCLPLCWNNAHCRPRRRSSNETNETELDSDVYRHIEKYVFGTDACDAIVLCEVWTGGKFLVEKLRARNWGCTSSWSAGLLIAWDCSKLGRRTQRHDDRGCSHVDDRLAFRHCRWTDCLARKGMLAVFLEFPGSERSDAPFLLAGTHLQSGPWSTVRKNQLWDALGFLSGATSSGVNVALVGDFNMEPRDMQCTLEELQREELDGTRKNHGTAKAASGWSVCQTTDTPTVKTFCVEGNTLDFAIVHTQSNTSSACRVLEDVDCPSDHYPVILTLPFGRW